MIVNKVADSGSIFRLPKAEIAKCSSMIKAANIKGE